MVKAQGLGEILGRASQDGCERVQVLSQVLNEKADC